ncbi:MAG: carbamoyltransferase [Motiliproteus sp.]|nr:carbamoyltransferase [Motiliproteus sp.]MCW9051893.1 carbamoyltransferase [Motiliproteus sp.]
MAKTVLGISAFYHDSAATICRDGKIIAAAQEERFSRKKHDPDFPAQAISFCLKQAGVNLTDLDAVVFYDKPFLTFDRILETYFSFAPRGLRSFLTSMPIWLKDKLALKSILRKQLTTIGNCKPKQLPKLLFTDHHQSHAASAFFASPFDSAVVLCLDGVGEWATTSAWIGKGDSLEPLWQIRFPHSIGLLYSAFTYFCGFKVNSGEYKLMGLAPYGSPRYRQKILDHLIDIKEDGSFQINLEYFDYCVGQRMTNDAFAVLFDGPPRNPDTKINQREADLAASIQSVTEEVVLRLAKTLQKETGVKQLCLAGGVALNCTANGRLARSAIFDDIWIQPAAGDAGGSIGAALAATHIYFDQPRQIQPSDLMQGAYLGPEYNQGLVKESLDHFSANFVELSDKDLYSKTASLLAEGQVVGWFQGRMEFGPRALGNRSILADPRNSEMQSRLNLKIKYRESFRPFAPAVLAEKADEYFEMNYPSPYMLLTETIQEPLRIKDSLQQMEELRGLDKLAVSRSILPAITHIDMSGRVQTVHPETNPKFHRLISEFEKQSECAVLINTSFNVRGEPIVCTPEDAYRCFMNTEMDYLVINNYLLAKEQQPTWNKNLDFAPD